MKGITSFIIGFLLFFIVACNQKKPPNLNKKIVKDYFGHSVIIPTDVQRTIPLYYVQAEIICAIGAKKNIVGIGKINIASSSFLRDYFSDILILPQVGNQNNVDYEKIISLKPDIVFAGTEKPTIDRLKQLGVTAIATYPKNFKEIIDEIILYGNVLGKEKQAERLCELLDSIITRVRTISINVPQNAKPKVYYIRTDALTTLGGNTQGEIIDLAGGKLVTNGTGNNETSLQVSLENVYVYNPDVIIIRDRASIDPEDIYNDEKWTNINAVKNRRIYKEHYGWTEFRLETVFGLVEKAKWLQPELFKDFNCETEYLNFVDIIKQNCNER